MPQHPKESIVRLFQGGEAWLDFAFDDFSEGNVGIPHARTTIHESGTSGSQLLDSFRNEIDQDGWVRDDEGGLVHEFGFHREAGI